MEIVKINLENEMDLILSHKRSMKLAELCGLSVLVQTSFATAVSEISRCVIGDDNDKPALTLSINILRGNKKELIASITSGKDFESEYTDAVRYARRLTDNLQINSGKKGTEIILTQNINFSGLINEARLQAFVDYFKTEIPLSPYDELRKKNIQLLEVSEKLRDSENQYRMLTETLPLMMFTTNSVGNITYANKWLKDFFKLAEIHPGKVAWLSFINPTENTQIREEWEKALLNQAPFRAQAKMKAKNDVHLWHLISLIPVKNEQGQATSWTGFFVDINAQKLIEDTLKNNEDLKSVQKQLLNYQARLEEKVQELNRSNHDLEQFAYIASHDLQEPLRKIRNFSDLLEKSLHDEEKVRKYAAKIDLSSSRMLSLIKDVLNYSRLSKNESNFENASLQDTLQNVKLDMELLIEEKGAVIKTPAPLPVINCIPQQMYQLFYNFISNSLKFSKGQPEITINYNTLTPQQVKQHPTLNASSKYIEISVKDNGIGFDEKYSKQVFTIFKRLHPRDAYSGSGIGLALCKKIVDNHHGLISVSSQSGVGTEFKVILPVA